MNVVKLPLVKRIIHQTIQKFVTSAIVSFKMTNFVHKKRLAAFDFDNTIVLGNTDIVIRDLLKNDIPSNVQELAKSEGWTRYMEEVFRILHGHKNKFTPERILQSIREIPEVPGFVKLLKSLHQVNFDLIIISDSNSEFINEWIETHGLGETFTAVFTNPASFSEEGLLTIQPYHYQKDCKLSAENLCKGKILQDFIAKREADDGVCYQNVVYVGDGTNDICPVMRLTERDIGCVRNGYGMKRILEKNKHKLVPKSKIVFWSNGFDLLDSLHEVLEDIK